MGRILAETGHTAKGARWPMLAMSTAYKGDLETTSGLPGHCRHGHPSQVQDTKHRHMYFNVLGNDKVIVLMVSSGRDHSGGQP